MNRIGSQEQKHHLIMKMAKLPSMLTMLLIFMTIIKQSSSARNLGNPTPSYHNHQHHNHHKITFLMQDVLTNVTHSSSKPATTKVTSQLPFPKPLGLFPPLGGIPLPQSNPTTQTLDISNIGLFFQARATLQELEFGAVTTIDEDLFERSGYGSPILGKAQGVYVASSENGTSHMMAMTITLVNNEFKDGLRFFGVLQKDAPESHIAVIGGIGKYHSANGYATIKAVDVRSNDPGEENGTKKLLLFNVHVS